MSVGGFAGQLGPGDIERALARFGPLTTVWQVQAVQAQNQVAVVRADNAKVVPVLGPSLAADFVGADVAWVTGALAGMPVGGDSYGQFQTTIQQITSTAGPPPVTSVLFADSWPVAPQAGDQFVVIRNLSRRTVVVTSGLPVDSLVQSDLILPESSLVTIPDSANVVVLRILLSFFNDSNTALAAGSNCLVFFSGAEIAGIPLAGLAGASFAPLVTIEFSPGVATTAEGVALETNTPNVVVDATLIVGPTTAPILA